MRRLLFIIGLLFLIGLSSRSMMGMHNMGGHNSMAETAPHIEKTFQRDNYTAVLRLSNLVAGDISKIEVSLVDDEFNELVTDANVEFVIFESNGETVSNVEGSDGNGLYTAYFEPASAGRIDIELNITEFNSSEQTWRLETSDEIIKSSHHQRSTSLYILGGVGMAAMMLIMIGL